MAQSCFDTVELILSDTGAKKIENLRKKKWVALRSILADYPAMSKCKFLGDQLDLHWHDWTVQRDKKVKITENNRLLKAS